MARREPGLPSPGLWAPVFWMSKGLRIGKPCACGCRVPALPSGHVQASCSPLGLQELRPPQASAATGFSLSAPPSRPVSRYGPKPSG